MGKQSESVSCSYHDRADENILYDAVAVDALHGMLQLTVGPAVSNSNTTPASDTAMRSVHELYTALPIACRKTIRFHSHKNDCHKYHLTARGSGGVELKTFTPERGKASQNRMHV